MAIKTISVELDAYEKLRGAKRGPRESFSSVVRRAQWDDLPLRAPDLLADLRALVQQHPEVLLTPRVLDAPDGASRLPVGAVVRRASRHQFSH